MFEPVSRYYSLRTATLTTSDGRTVTFVTRRFLPQGEQMRLLVEVKVTEAHRIDLVTAGTLGDPEQFWRVCDANNAMNPFDFTDEPGQTVRVAVPEPPQA